MIPLTVDQALRLLPLQEEEAPILFALVEQNRTYLRTFLGWVDGTRSPDDTRLFIQNPNERNWGLYLNQELIGVVGLHTIDPLNRSAQIGYWIASAHQGRGIMSRAVKRLIDYAFYALRFHRLEIVCATHNSKSSHLAQRLSFKKEGHLEEALCHYGRYFDAELYALIYKEEKRRFETERMVLRAFDERDTDHMQKILADPVAMRFYPSTKDIESTKRGIERTQKRYQEGFGFYACHLKTDGEFVGMCGLLPQENVRGRKEVEVGYLFVRAFWNQGLATEAVKGWLKEKKGERVVALMDPENGASKRVAEKNGMRFEGETVIEERHFLIYAKE